jgi:hypothetical protein
MAIDVLDFRTNNTPKFTQLFIDFISEQQMYNV